MHDHSQDWRLALAMIAVCLLAVLIAPKVSADTNLAWVLATSANRDAGTWQRVAADTLVLCRTQSQTYETAPVVAFSGCLTDVFACTADRTVGAGSGCPAAGNYADERFIPRDQVAQVVVAPPDPPVVTFAALPVRIQPGGTVTLTWAATNTQVCRASGGGWNEGDLPASGSRVVTPAAGYPGYTFQLSCDSLPGALLSAPTQVRAVDVVQPFTPPSAPGCYPYLTPGVVNHEAPTIDGGIVAGFGCDKSTGYVWRTVWRKGDLGTALANCAPLALMAAINEQTIDAAWIACLTQPHTPTTKVVADDLTRKWKPHFVVATVASGARPVYLRNADGTRGARIRIGGVNQSIATGQPCDGRRRLSGTTRYHEVSGKTSVTNQVLPADSFTVCTMQSAPAAGWP